MSGATTVKHAWAAERANTHGRDHSHELQRGFAIQLGMTIEAADFRSSVRFASNSVLSQLAEGHVTLQPEDDLESLVKSMFYVSHHLDSQRLHEVAKNKYTRIRERWNEVMHEHPAWDERDAAGR